MKNYNLQYKKYYDELQKRGAARYNFNNYGNRVDNDSINYESKPKNKFFIDLINVFIYQIMMVILLFMFIFYVKYSGSVDNEKVFSNIKGYISGEIKIESVFKEVKLENINKIFSNIDKEIKVSE